MCVCVCFTCTACTCGDWITDGCAAWITPWTWTVCPLGSWTSVTVGPAACAWPAAMDTWNSGVPMGFNRNSDLYVCSMYENRGHSVTCAKVAICAEVICWFSVSVTAVSAPCWASAAESIFIDWAEGGDLKRSCLMNFSEVAGQDGMSGSVIVYVPQLQTQ